MILTRRYRFSASHRLHSSRLSGEENQAVYGKCNNPYGHGHDYVLEVSLRGPADGASGVVAALEDVDELVRRSVLGDFRNANLNIQIPAFAGTGLSPTTENVAVEVRRRLADGWDRVFPDGRPRLHKIRLYETRKNIIELAGD